MNVINARSLAYATNCTVAALAAIWISGCWGLPNPGWAALTVFISSQPLAGAVGGVTARASFRFAGTLAGCTAALVIIPAMASTPELLIGVLALWAAFCLYLSLIDKSARSYAFMLAAYTPVLVALPQAGAPANLFDSLLLRVEEVGTGALCAAVAHAIFFPRTVEALSTGKLQAIAQGARRLVLQALDTQVADASTQAARASLARSMAELRQLVDHLRFDAVHSRTDPHAVPAIEQALVALSVLVAAVEDRLLALGGQQAVPPRALAYLQAVAGAIAEDASGERFDQLESLRAGAMPAPGELEPGQEALAVGLVLRTGELARTLCTLARLVAGQASAADVQELSFGARRALHIDHGFALLAGASVGLTLVLAGAITYMMGWQQGASVVGLAATGSSVFAFADDPRPMLRSFLKVTLAAIPVAAAYVFAILPAVDSFPGFALALAPLYFTIGLFMASPKYGFAAYGMALVVSTLLSLQVAGTADFIAFTGLAIGSLTGTTLALLGTSLYRVIGPAASVRRIVRASRAELLRLARGGEQSRTDWASRALDRVALLLPRVGDAPGPVRTAFAEARLGASVIELREYSRLPQAAARHEVDDALAALARRLEAADAGAASASESRLQAAVSRATAAIAANESGELRARALAAAGGLQRGTAAAFT
ncbi:MAG: hypothetical protein JWQ76_3639 [Ramlibacter sp.]|nr:hypothetical protein [Ramlibacter sp.]